MIRLSPTAVLKHETCPYQYLLEEVLRIRPAHRAANLVFGTVLHRTVEDWLRAADGAAPDPVAVFDRDWAAARERRWGRVFGDSIAGVPDRHRACPDQGLRNRLADLPTAAGGRYRRHAAAGAQAGSPARPRLVYVGRTDLLTFTSDGELECLDSNPITPTDLGLAGRRRPAHRLPVVAGRPCRAMGITPVERLGLLELVKRKVPTRTGKGPKSSRRSRCPVTDR